MVNSFSVWDWQHRKRLNYFCNGNPKGTSITSLEIINQDVGGIILTGSGKLRAIYVEFRLLYTLQRTVSFVSTGTTIQLWIKDHYRWSVRSVVSTR